MLSDLILLVGHVHLDKDSGIINGKYSAACSVNGTYISATGKTAGHALVRLANIVRKTQT